jgi:hypothetical protein
MRDRYDQRFIGKILYFPVTYVKNDNCFFQYRGYLCTIRELYSIINFYFSDTQSDLHHYLQNFKSDFVIVWKKIPLPLVGAAAFSHAYYSIPTTPHKGLMIALHSGFLSLTFGNRCSPVWLSHLQMLILRKKNSNSVQVHTIDYTCSA